MDGKDRPDIGNEAHGLGKHARAGDLRAKRASAWASRVTWNITVPFTHPTLPLQCSLDGIGFGQGADGQSMTRKPVYTSSGWTQIVLDGEGVIEAKTTKDHRQRTPLTWLADLFSCRAR
jgi:hypothetical protein